MSEIETMDEHGKSTEEAERVPQPRRKRTGRKRVSFKRLPQPAPAVRALWNAASEAEREKAHRLCMAILAYWLGRASKEETASRLSVPGLRVWQLSQQALSGMLAGLLRQPRTRPRLVADSSAPQEDPRTLRQRIGELEKKLSRTEDLVRVLQHLPRAQKQEGQAHGPGARGARARSATKRRRSTRTQAARPSRAAGDRRTDPDAAPPAAPGQG